MFVPYPEFAISCFENGEDTTRVEAACECLSQDTPGSSPLSNSDSGSGPSSGAGQEGKASPGSSGAGFGAVASNQPIVTTEMYGCSYLD